MPIMTVLTPLDSDAAWITQEFVGDFLLRSIEVSLQNNLVCQCLDGGLFFPSFFQSIMAENSVGN